MARTKISADGQRNTPECRQPFQFKIQFFCLFLCWQANEAFYRQSLVAASEPEKSYKNRPKMSRKYKRKCIK